MVAKKDKDLIAVGAADSRPNPGHQFVPGVSLAMRALERAVAEIAPTEIPVLLVGESGTGKEVIALEIHRLSKRSGDAFVKCSCAGLSPDSLALRASSGGSHPGNEATTGGSLLLDEISQLDPATQERFLSLLPGDTGAPSEGSLSVRVISSTTRNLEEEMRRGRFREELYYRINGVYLRLPPLRQRKDDIPYLLDFFLKKYSSLFGRPEPVLWPATMDLLLGYSWPGNIRELENLARKIVVLGNEQLAISDIVEGGTPKMAEPVPGSVPEHSRGNGRSLKEVARQASRKVEREMILQQLERTHWNRKRTASELQISYKSLLIKLKQMGLDGSDNADGS
jgi:two-component system, NtrC family, response regulator AtoC